MLSPADIAALRELRCAFFEKALIASKHRHPEEAKHLREQYWLLDRVVEEVERPLADCRRTGYVLEGGPRDAA